MKNFNSIFNQLTAMPKRLAMVLTMLLIVGIGQAWGAEYTITFKSASSDSSSDLGASPNVSNVVSSGTSYVASFSECSKMYVGKSGIKLGSNSATGTMNFTLATNYQSNIKSIKVVSAKYGSDTGTLTLYTGSTSLKSGISPGTDYTHTFSSPTKVTSLKLATSAKRAYITKIVITTEEAATCTQPPTISAATSSDITQTTAMLSCSGISSLGSAGCSITSYGFVYGTSSNPTISNTKVQVGTTYATTGTDFSKELTGLTANTTYYVRPYATNGNGTAYGTQTSFKTLELPTYTVTLVPGSGSVTDTELEEESAGAGVELPEPTLNCGEWSFAGWKTSSAVTEETTTKPTLIPAGAYNPASNITLYAVYQRTDGGGGGGNTSVTFTDEDSGGWTTTAGKQTGSKDGVTISTDNGIYSQNNNQLRVYKDATFTVSSTNTIISIIFSSSNYDWSTYDVGTYKDKMWTGQDNSVTFTAGNGQVRITQLVVTTSGGGPTTYYHSTPECAAPCTDPGLAYATTSVAKTVGDEAFTNPLTNNKNVSVTYTSTNTDVATVAGNGQVTIKAAGTTTIKATWAGDATYCEDEASYELKVNPKTYTITIADNIQYGTVEADKASAEEGETIKLTITPTSGYKLKTITVTKNGGGTVEVQNNQFTMPASNVTVTATFVAIPQLETPTNLSATDITTTAATLTWGWSDNENSQYLNGYNLYYKKVGEANFTGPLTCNSNSSTRTGLTPNTEYVFKVAATSNNINECKSSEQSAEFTFNTLPLPTYTITWMANGHEHHSQTNVEGTAIEIPAEPKAATYACDDKVFVGWLDKTISGSTNEEPTFVTDFGTIQADKTYHAVFATLTGTPSNDYNKITNINDLTDGEYVIAYSYDGGTQVVLKNTTKDAEYMNASALAPSSNKYTSPSAEYIWQVQKQDDGSYYMYNSSVNKFLYATTSALQLSDNPTKYTISYDNTYSHWKIKLTNNTSYYMHGYVSGSSYDFRVSTSGSSNKYQVYLYKNASTAVYSDYTTTCVEVQKYEVTYNIGDGATGTAPTETSKAEGTIFTLASADGISKEGYSFDGWLCDNDSKKYGASDAYTMPAADVIFTAQWNELPKYTVTFYNKGKKHSEVAQTIANAPIECPTGLVACDGYTFAGWSTEELDGVSTFSKIEGEYTPTENITLYAVYAEGNVTTNGWVKVTDLSTITEGTYALLSNNDYAFNGTISKGDGQSTSTAFVFDGEGVATSVPNGICEIQLIATGSGFTMYNESKGYLYAKAASSGNLEWHATENSSWSWSSTKENWVYADNNAYLRSYNNTFRTYGNSSNNAIYFAKKNVTSFTTSPACDPMITIGSEAPVMVTSAKDIRVDAVQNITISATNLDQNADAAQVSIKLVSDNSAFKFKEVGANGDGQATSTWTGIANATFDKTLCVTYTPTVSGREETATLTVTAYRHNGSTEYATATMQVRGRSLPEQFVLVANTTDGWVALPNTLGTGSSSSIPYPIAVEVDNDANPTSIPLAPSTTIYKAAARSTVNATPTGLRFTTETGGYMQASTTDANIWLASNNSENMQSWTLNSTDFVDYSIRVNNAAEGHYLNYNNTQKKIGNYKSDNKLRILPVGAVCEQHAAPEDIEASSVRATSATIQWSAVSTATAGYEYRIGATGEWTKIGNVTELEIAGLDPLTNYVVYVRASVEGAIINCSNEAEVSFTTTNCDDVPTNITHTSSSQSITVSWEAKAATSIVKLYSDKEGTTEVKSIESSSPCTLSDLEKYTTYYVQILAGGDCPSQIIEVSTLIPNINIAEWMTDGILVDVDTDEDVSVIIENEESYGSATGQLAEDLFFSKYFEGSGSLKLLAIYNGTGKDVDLSTYRIDRGSNGNATNISKTYDLSQLGTIKNGQEIIFYSWPLNTSSEESVYSCSQSFLNAKSDESGADANPRWILCDANPHNGVEFEAMDFSGDDPLLFYKDNTLIDVFGVSTAADRPSKKTQCSGRSEESWSADGVTNMDYNKTDADFEGGVIPEGVDLLNPTITAYTARVIMFRKNTVTSGSDAVTKNTTDFVTFADEWEARSVCKSGGDGDLTCAAYQELGTFDYSEYYTQYNTVGSEQVFPGENRTDGTVKITIEGLPNYSCHNIKLNLKIGEDLKLTEITKVPILISDDQTTKITSSTFTTLKSTLGVIDPETKEKTDLTDEQLIEKCETCDIVVLANGKLTHETDGIDQFNDLTIYPEGVFHNTSEFNVNRLLIHAKKDDVGYAIIENEGVRLTTDAIAHTKRIDAQYWYPFSLPYNCNIADITQANGEPLGDYGVHWGIQYYDGKKRQESGTSAGIGQSSNFWTPIYNSNEQLKAYQGYMIALFDASVSSPTEMRTIYFPPVSEQMYTESGTDSKETTITSWNVNLEAEKRHHGWNFTGSPYISVFNPQATGLSKDYGLAAEVLMISGHYDPETNEYLYDDNNVYVSVPSPNGAKYYDQYITSATSLKPFTAYFVQAIDPTSGNDETQTLAYAKAGRELPTSAPRRSTSTRQRVFVELNVTAPDGQTDNTGVWVDDCYNATYEIAADLTKMYVADAKPQLYTLDSNNEKMAYNAIPDENAENVILGLYAPVAGNYTLALNNRVSRLQGAETVELLYNGNVVANLFYEDYVISADKGIVNGYSLRIRRRTLVDSAIDNITGQIMHIINEDGILTIEGVATDAQVSVYDMLGRLVAVQSADGKTNISMPIMTQGVYNVVVGNDYGKTTVKVVLK